MNDIKKRLQTIVEREKQDLRTLRANMAKLSRVMGDVSFKNKASWPGFAERVLGAIVDGQGLHDDVHYYMETNGRKIVAEDIPLAIHHFGLNRENDIVFDQDETRAFRDYTQKEQDFYIVQYNDNVEWDLFLHESIELQDIYEHLADQLWQDKTAVRLDLKQTGHYSSEIALSSLELGHHRYIGQLSKHIDEWKKFKEAKIRRNILLQGRPGCGKSTLCLHAARQLSQRTVVITAKVFEDCTVSEWHTILEMLKPEMLILDDVDRVGSSVLGSKLETIEERNCNIPFIMFTSNDIEQIPAAFRRPGRIDQILAVDEPSTSARRNIIERFGQQLNVQIPERHIQRLIEMITTHSGAHAFEAIKRGKVLGWDYVPGPEDLTFKKDEEKSSD